MNSPMSRQRSNTVLIAGGYGVVGTQIAEILRERHPSISLMLGGRNPNKAEALAKRLGLAETLEVDVESQAPLKNLKTKPSLILSAVNDPSNYLLEAAIEAGIPYVDITRWTERMRDATVCASLGELQAPVIFSSAWMAGVAAIVTQAASSEFSSIDKVDLSILFAMADKAGPNSIEYMDRMHIPFTIKVDGKAEQRMPFSDPKSIAFPGGYTGPVYRFDVPDQVTLPATIHAKSVNGRIGFDDALTTRGLAFMVKSGIMKLLSLPIFDGLRNAMMYNPGDGAAHEIIIEIEGKNMDGRPHQARVEIVDPQGQTHLTACGAVIQLERVLGLNGHTPPSAGIHYPEKSINVEAALQLLKDNEVSIVGVAKSSEHLLKAV